jgi:hypothetical protein
MGQLRSRNVDELPPHTQSETWAAGGHMLMWTHQSGYRTGSSWTGCVANPGRRDNQFGPHYGMPQPVPAPSSVSALRITSSCVLGDTFLNARAIVPSGPMMKVERRIPRPMERPYIDFSTQVP